MNKNELLSYIHSDQTSTTHNSEEILEHFYRKHQNTLFNGDILFIFDHARDFRKRNHIIELHPRCSGMVPQHIYHYIVMTYCYSGEMTFKIDDKIIVLKQGDMIIFDRHVPHSVKPTGPNDLGLNIILSDEYFLKKTLHTRSESSLIDSFFRELMHQPKTHVHYLILHTQGDFLFESCMDQILCEYADPKTGSEDIIDSLIQIVLTASARIKEIQSNMSGREYKKQEIINDIMTYIQNNYRSGSLQEMCNHFGYESSYTSRIIKQATGKTFKQLVNEERMKTTVRLLSNPELPISDIAERVGISNLTIFYQRFRDAFGMNPQTYRESLISGSHFSTPDAKTNI